jgi:hypothetical protein
LSVGHGVRPRIVAVGHKAFDCQHIEPVRSGEELATTVVDAPALLIKK